MLTIKESFYDGESSTKNIAVGVFPAVGENLYVARGFTLILRDHAGDRQFTKQSRCGDVNSFPGPPCPAGDLCLETIKSFNEVA